MKCGVYDFKNVFSLFPRFSYCVASSQLSTAAMVVAIVVQWKHSTMQKIFSKVFD